VRITATRLQNRFQTLATMMGWNISPAKSWDALPGGGMRAHVGFTYLEHNSVYGWSIKRIVNEDGGETRLKESCSATEMDAWLGGAIFAADRLKRPTP
jgi:hypothetical protein